MKGRNGSTGIETTHVLSEQVKYCECEKGRQSLSATQSLLLRQLRPARVAFAVATLATVFLLGAFLVSYGLKLYQNWRENRVLDRATALLQEGKLSEAAQMARELLARNPDSFPTLSILAETAERQNLEEAVSWRERIARLRPNDSESQLNYASAALRFGKLDLAREALNRVSGRDCDSAAFHIVAGWLARAEGNFAEQEEQFAAAVNKEPKNNLYQFNLAALQIRSKEAEKSKNARYALERLSKIAPYRTGALRALLNDAVECNDLTAADGFAQQLQMSPDITFADYLLCLNFYRKLDGKKFRLLLERVKPFAARNSSDLAALIEWMNQNGSAGDVVKWIDKLPAAQLNSPPASIALADAYATAKNWSRLRRWTQTGTWGDAEYMRLAFQAIAVRRLRSGNGTTANSASSDFETLWQSANEWSKNEPERELALARLATKWRLESQAEELWLGLEDNPSMRHEALNSLRQLFRANGETTKLYDVLQRLHESSPNEATITADLARLGLNLDQNTERSHQLAKEAYDRAPNDINCAVTYSFSLHRLGRSREALGIIERLSPGELYDPHAAVYAALVLIEAGQLDAANEDIAVAETDKLYPEEEKLLEEAKTRLVAAAATPSPTNREIAPSLKPMP
jgi:lipopolysaccharide biosynthesis regulator YciM